MSRRVQYLRADAGPGDRTRSRTEATRECPSQARDRADGQGSATSLLPGRRTRGHLTSSQTHKHAKRVSIITHRPRGARPTGARTEGETNHGYSHARFMDCLS